jgi:hypothetical protein
MNQYFLKLISQHHSENFISEMVQVPASVDPDMIVLIYLILMLQKRNHKLLLATDF